MMGLQRTGLRRLANVWRAVHKQTPLSQNRTQQIGCISKVSSQLLPPTTTALQTNIQPMRDFSLIPGKGECKKGKSSKCPKKCTKKASEESKGGCCPHPPPSCASVCRSCPTEKKGVCPQPSRPPQPCHCPYVMDVKHKPGHCPGPCATGEKDC